MYYAPDMFKAVIKNTIAEYDEDIVSMGAVHETYAILTTDLAYTPESALNAREDIINFQNGLLVVTAADVHLIPHTPDILTTIQIPCNYTENLIPTPKFDPQIRRTWLCQYLCGDVRYVLQPKNSSEKD